MYLQPLHPLDPRGMGSTNGHSKMKPVSIVFIVIASVAALIILLYWCNCCGCCKLPAPRPRSAREYHTDAATPSEANERERILLLKRRLSSRLSGKRVKGGLNQVLAVRLRRAAPSAGNLATIHERVGSKLQVVANCI